MDLNLKNKKQVVLLMRNSQESLCIKIFGSISFTLSNFTDVSKNIFKMSKW